MSRVSLTREERKNFVENLRALRNSRYPGRGGSRKMAKDFNVVPQQWSHWENGKRTPNNDYMKRIAEFFGVKVTEMLKPGRFSCTADTEEPQRREDIEKGTLDLMQLLGTLSRMQTEALSGSRNSAKLSAMLRDILRYAKFVIAEAGEDEPKPIADTAPEVKEPE